MTKINLDTVEHHHSKLANDIREFMEENNREAPNTVYEALDMYLMWNGIIGYTGTIMNAIDILKKSEEE